MEMGMEMAMAMAMAMDMPYDKLEYTHTGSSRIIIRYDDDTLSSVNYKEENNKRRSIISLL